MRRQDRFDPEEGGTGQGDARFEYLGSYPNTYEYRNVSYHSCDLLFCCKIGAFPTEFDETEVEELVFMDPFEIADEELAFESIKMGLKLFRRLKSGDM